MDDKKLPQPASQDPNAPEAAGTTPRPPAPGAKPALPKEIGGAPGPEPTRYGDWQHKGRVTDF
jgi:hypothetical protein